MAIPEQSRVAGTSHSDSLVDVLDPDPSPSTRYRTGRRPSPLPPGMESDGRGRSMKGDRAR